ncbi:MAG: hypothetical protein K1X66_05870 [Verrucomicrobiae bacterium]|nr:hypothetical protein [Verrucomicrobiae bacterium]
MKKIIYCIFLLINCSSIIFAQVDTNAPPAVKMTKFNIETEAAQGGGGKWSKLITTFSSLPEWADGLVFNYEVLVQVEDRFRVLTGLVRYANVPKGINEAVLYLSPSATKRFGIPVAVTVGAFYNDQEVDVFKWSSGTKIPDGWNLKYNTYNGVLLNIMYTPWIASDYGRYPDLMAMQR